MSSLYTQPTLFFTSILLFLWFLLQMPLQHTAMPARMITPIFHWAPMEIVGTFFWLLLFLAGGIGLLVVASKWFLHNWQV